jgi:hypothetical protein
MAEYALTNASYPGVNTAYKRGTLLQAVLSFASGVPTVVSARSAPGFTIAGDTGVYTGTLPKAARGVLMVQLLTATAGAFATVTTLDPAAGTFSFKTFTDTTTAYDVATGDEVFLLYFAEGG